MSVPDTHFIEEFGEELKTKCLQNEPPFCEVACPFHMAILEMEDKWKRGRFNAVYRNYQNAVAFPGIVSELCPGFCEASCILKNRGGALALREIEKATVRLTKRKKPNSYNLPAKTGRAAIVGGGLSGLGCALRLCNKKYSVTVFEQEEVLGGRARSMMDPAVFDEEIRNQFSEEHPEFRTGCRVTDPAKLRGEYDVVYVAVGRGGQDYGLASSGSGAFASTLDGVFFGGEMAGAPEPVTALAQGIRAALALERYLKTGLMNEPEDTTDTRLIIDERRIPVQAKTAPADPAVGYTAEELAAEVERCRHCSCDICQKECDLMRIQEKTPGRLYEEAYITVRPSTLANDGRWATRRIASCDQCGLCKDVCPQRIDMGQFLMQSHRGLKDTNAMPWAFHDYWLRDMAFACGENAAVLRSPGVTKSSYAYFPGCQFGASDPDLEMKIAEWFFTKQPEGSLWKNCCGAPAVWAAENEWQAEHVEQLREMWRSMGEPTVIFACPSCRKMFERFLPEIPGMFLEEAVLEWGLPEKIGEDKKEKDIPDEDNKETAENCCNFKAESVTTEIREACKPENSFAVFDPCASRSYPQMQRAVRELADRIGVPHEDLPHSGDLARCCSYGGQYAIAAPDYAKRVRMERALESPLPYITSCMNCRDTFASRNKENVHILDLVFGEGDCRRKSPTLTQRRNNRIRLLWELRKMVQRMTAGQENDELCGDSLRDAGEEVFCGDDRKEDVMELVCSKELEEKLSDDYILLTDMEEVVDYCEKNLVGVCHEDGSITGHRKIGHMTFWASYRPLPDGRMELLNGYAHRMNLEGE